MISSWLLQIFQRTVLRRPRTSTLAFVLCLNFFGFAFALPVPGTGQTTCYDWNGNVITCPSPGQPFYGQDGNYTVNPMSYTKLDESGNTLPDSAESWSMVRDNVTGLIWETKRNQDWTPNYDDPHDADNGYTWHDSNPETNGGYAGTPGDGTDTEDFIQQLNDEHFGGFSDWRLPSLAELDSIVDLSLCKPAINWNFFLDTVMSDYLSPTWSSTTPTDIAQKAWGMYFDYGHDGIDDKINRYLVRAVRGGRFKPLENLINNGDGTVTDPTTGLMWQQATAPGTYTWAQALSYCENLIYPSNNGFSDWRLPSRKELRSIVDYGRDNPTIDTNYFPNTMASSYWSSTTVGSRYDTDDAWVMVFHLGSDSFSSKDYDGYVRAVRGGQNILPGHLAIESPSQASSWAGTGAMPITWDSRDLGGDVDISLSRDGGRTFEPIIEGTQNDGAFTWTVAGAGSVNCALKVTPLVDPSKATIQTLFTIDACPDDPDKIEPGQCGCGTADTDNDGDGIANCNDSCPEDSNKTTPGTCGCGTPDIDTDSDGTLDCKDACPADPNKTQLGVCGCGVADVDVDGDSVYTCQGDQCDNNPGKTAPGLCGCDQADTDTDSDGTPDCFDNCDGDPLKIDPGQCGCGNLDTDTDSDGMADCLDNCDHDPLKTEPGICSCGTPDTDSDTDGMPDYKDDCPNDPGKTAPGICSCGTPDTDTDGDKIFDCMDAFPAIKIFKGDLNNDGWIDLTDAILAVQLMAGVEPASDIYKEADVNNDGKIGITEIIYGLQFISGNR